MTRFLIPLIPLVLVLAGCGIDGPPQRPADTAPPPGITLSGEMAIGIKHEL